MRLPKHILAIALASFSYAGVAQDVGQTVYGNDGNPIGIIESVTDGVATVNTGKHEAPLPINLFGQGENGPSINATKAQIDAMMDARMAEIERQAAEAAAAQAAAEAEAAARLQAALIIGNQVLTADGILLGLVDELAGDNVVIKNAEEKLITLPSTLLSADTEGQLTALANYADIMAAVQATTS